MLIATYPSATNRFLFFFLALFVAMALLIVWNLSTQRELVLWVDHTNLVIRQSEEMLALFVDAETGQRGFLITGADRYLEPYDRALAKLPDDARQLRRLTIDNPRQQQRLDHVAAAAKIKMNALAATIQLYRDQRSNAARSMVLSDLGKTSLDEIRLRIAAIEAEESQLLAGRIQRRRQNFAQLAFGVRSSSVFGLSFLFIANWQRRRRNAEKLSSLQSEDDLAERTRQLEASDSQLASAILTLQASGTREETDKDSISKLGEALSERTVLLQEVHHRVKNNLAVIVALLGMQADELQDEKAVQALVECQRRVASMALIHEFLYGNKHLDRVNFGRYVERLTNELRASCTVEPDLVSISVTAEDIDLPIDQAIPCGLIVNELVSNALKYAYPRGDSGEIRIRFGRLESGKFSLSCQDNGAGIAESFDWKNSSSLGLRIIQILTKQLRGELKLDRADGTKSELSFSEYVSKAAAG